MNPCVFALLLWGSVIAALPAASHGEGFTYVNSKGCITITGYTGPGGAVTIPRTIEGLPVTAIGDSAFCNCKSLSSISIPDGVTSIGNHAFFQCSDLAEVVIPASLANIGIAAFSACRSLSAITFPNHLANIGNSAFANCSSLTSVTIPDTVTNIGDQAFFNCYNMTNVSIPTSVTRVASGAFPFGDRLGAATVREVGTNVPSWRSGMDLQTVFSGTPEQKAALVRRLKQQSDPRLMGWLVETAKDPERHSAYLAALMLVDMHYDGADAYDGFLKMLDTSGDAGIRELGAKGLGHIRDPRAVDALGEALHDNFQMVRAAAAIALGKIGGNQAGDLLLKARRAKVGSGDFRAVLNLALGMCRYTNAVPDLVHSLQMSNLTDIAASLKTSMPPLLKTNLAPMKSPLAELLAYFSEDQYAGKWTAAKALGQIGSEDAVQGLLVILQEKDQDPRIRSALVRALGIALSAPSASLPQPVVSSSLEELTRLKNDPVESLRQEATNSLNLIENSSSRAIK